MAHLYRHVNLNDRWNTNIFTFILPASLTNEYATGKYSRDFVYGNQKWNILLNKGDKHLSSYLTLKNAAKGMACTVDYTVSLLNQEHFTKNECFTNKASMFSSDQCTHGLRTFVGIGDLTNRRFMHDNGEFLVEIELKNCSTIFRDYIQLPSSNQKHHRDRNHYYANDYDRLETTYFCFGMCDWSLILYPDGDSKGSEGIPRLHLCRHTSFDHLCRAEYKFKIGQGDRVYLSEKLTDILNESGMGQGFLINDNLHSLAIKGKLRIQVEMLSVTAISEVKIAVLNRTRNRAKFYDRDKQAWVLETDIDSEFLKLRLYYSDVNNVPRKFTRYVRWAVNVVPQIALKGQAKRSIDARGSPFSNYYAQHESDEGYEMQVDIPTIDINDPESLYLDGDNKMTFHIEWKDSHLLYHAKYHRHDDITATHKHQMTKEIMALQAENHALEKQVHGYQLSIAKQEAEQGPAAVPIATASTPQNNPNSFKSQSQQNTQYQPHGSPKTEKRFSDTNRPQPFASLSNVSNTVTGLLGIDSSNSGILNQPKSETRRSKSSASPPDMTDAYGDRIVEDNTRNNPTKRKSETKRPQPNLTLTSTKEQYGNVINIEDNMKRQPSSKRKSETKRPNSIKALDFENVYNDLVSLDDSDMKQTKPTRKSSESKRTNNSAKVKSRNGSYNDLPNVDDELKYSSSVRRRGDIKKGQNGQTNLNPMDAKAVYNDLNSDGRDAKGYSDNHDKHYSKKGYDSHSYTDLTTYSGRKNYREERHYEHSHSYDDDYYDDNERDHYDDKYNGYYDKQQRGYDGYYDDYDKRYADEDTRRGEVSQGDRSNYYSGQDDRYRE
ncbi:unnamed protein product [Owenia fusiformis]|uniref:Uncharacterized protein n=1 Tax=Owenia fusiformis TaxID=6347 RepID=A0A8J1TV56_OWEFU|nr:unnamed protein product [Owenia fusiformis]